MQKTLTINGKRYSANQIANLLDKNNMTNGGDYIITLNGQRFYANYRQVQDDHFAPACDIDEANAIALMPDDGLYKWSIWLEWSHSNNTKTRHQEILSAAHQLLANVDVTTEYNYRQLAKQLQKLTDCHYDTAKRNLAKAARQKRYQIVKNWGGKREGSGRPSN